MIVARERATVACARGPQWHDEHYPGIVFLHYAGRAEYAKLQAFRHKR
jgi:hypothetical protein